MLAQVYSSCYLFLFLFLFLLGFELHRLFHFFCSSSREFFFCFVQSIYCLWLYFYYLIKSYQLIWLGYVYALICFCSLQLTCIAFFINIFNFKKIFILVLYHSFNKNQKQLEHILKIVFWTIQNKKRQGKKKERKKSLDVKPNLTTIHASPKEKEDTETHQMM
jgi:hypothetical protein